MLIPSAVAGQDSHYYSMSLEIINAVLPCIHQALHANDVGILRMSYLILSRLPCFELTFVSSNYSLGHSFIPYSFIHLSDVLSTPSPSHLSCWKPIRACLDQLFDQCIDEGSSYLSVSRSSTYDAADVLWGIWGQNSGLT